MKYFIIIALLLIFAIISFSFTYTLIQIANYENNINKNTNDFENKTFIDE